MTEDDLDQNYPSQPVLRRSDAGRTPFEPALARRALSSVLALSMTLGALAPLLATTILPRLALADTPAVAPTETPSDVAPDAMAVTDPAAIRAKLNDTTIYGRYYDGENWIEYHLADGRTAYSERGCTYPGKWWEQDGQVCYAYPNYRGGAPNCFILFVRPDGSVEFVALADGGGSYLASFSLKVEHGNTANLPIGGISPCVGV